MILPSKHLSQDRALLTVGARILRNLHQPKTVSALWEECVRVGQGIPHAAPTFSYNGFVLTLDVLFLIGAIEMEDGLLTRKSP